MNPQTTRWQRLLRCAVLAAGLQAATGCHSFFHCGEPLPPSATPPGQAPETTEPNRVHVFLIHGIDLFDSANLQSVEEHIRGLGFANTHLGQFYQAAQFEEDIRALHRADPKAHFVVVGFSMGAALASGLVEALQPDGVTVDLLVYLDGKAIVLAVADAPTNARRVVNVVCPGYLWTAPTRTGTENLLLQDTWHFGVPSHPRTLEMLTKELTALAAPKSLLAPAPSPSPAPEPIVDADPAWPTPASIALRPPGPGLKSTLRKRSA